METRELKKQLERGKAWRDVMVGDGRECVERDAFGGGGGEVLVGVLRRFEEEDCDGEGGVVSEDEVGELYRRDQVAVHAWRWEQNYSLLHNIII